MLFQEMITPEQCRAARGLLDWSQKELANKAAGAGDGDEVEPMHVSAVYKADYNPKANLRSVPRNGAPAMGSLETPNVPSEFRKMVSVTDEE